MKFVTTALVCVTLAFAATTARGSTCQTTYYSCLINPGADISACITQNQQCLNNEYQATVQQQQNAYQEYLKNLQASFGSFYSNPIFSDPWLSALYGVDPNLLIASFNAQQQYWAEQQALQNYFAQQYAQQQRDQAALAQLWQILLEP